MDLTGILIAVLGTGAVTAIITVLFNRRAVRASVRQTNAETEQIAQKTKQDETLFYQGRVEETIKQMRILEARVKELQSAIETAREQYERQVGGLYTKVDGLVIALERANTSLDTANETIAQLRQEVKKGNEIITMLQDKITKLLEEKAESRQE